MGGTAFLLSGDCMTVAVTKMSDVLLRRKEVLEIMRFSNARLYRMIANGGFPPPLKLPGTRVIAWRKSDLEKWMRDLKPKS